MGYGDEFCPSSRPADGYSVCAKCFEDEDIKTFIEANAKSSACDFCHHKSRSRAIAAPLDEVVDFMLRSIEREYELAVNALGWNSREGGYQGTYWDSCELLTDAIGIELPRDDDGQLLGILETCLGVEPWCERDPYSLREDQRLIGSWRDFCEFIKHKRRYFFLKENDEERDREYLSPANLLAFIGETVNEHGLVRNLQKGSLLYRARHFKAGEILSTPYDFGPPSIALAKRSNRMSPAGIVMFYASDDCKTAVAEIDDAPDLGMVVGTFRTTRDAAFLDLDQKCLPRCFRFFEQQSDSDCTSRYALDFLHSFVTSVAAKVEPGEREHVDYVPTQVVTEWFRTFFRHGNSPIDGIRYTSAQATAGTSVVLFADRDDLVLTPTEITEIAKAESEKEWFLRSCHDKAWLKLVRRRIVREPH